MLHTLRRTAALAALVLLTTVFPATASADEGAIAPSLPSASAPPRPAPPPRADGQLTAAWVTGGAGLAALALSGIMGALALVAKGEMDDAGCRKIGPQEGICSSGEGLRAADRAQAYGLVSTLALGVGLAGAAAGTILLVTAPRAPGGPRAAITSSVRVGVLAVGSEGASFGFKGAW